MAMHELPSLIQSLLNLLPVTDADEAISSHALTHAAPQQSRRPSNVLTFRSGATTALGDGDGVPTLLEVRAQMHPDLDLDPGLRVSAAPTVTTPVGVCINPRLSLILILILSLAVAQVNLSCVGRCAEIQLIASGGARAAAIYGAVGALRSGLADDVKLEVSFASEAVLGLLRRASLALQAELSGAARVCDLYFGVPSRTTGHASNGQDVQAQSQPPSAVADAQLTSELVAHLANLQSITDTHMSYLHELLS